ncbi:60s ribosomal protein l19, mitochondrial precursor [Naematelia encephala]|uniref:Large ribosomal subunit protein uL11m n=1 Tax=Naematelia encephala TaxID=71784 RepID=A0A1Y2AZY0_9TREE|nr:60s ribosomal protein l19, mitochondrial precursor [Naematelia encephala]
MSKAAATAVQFVKLTVPAGKATPSPPVGPAMGARGVKAIDFCKEFNARTADYIPETPIPCLVKISPDRTFTFETRTPPVSYLLKKAAKIEKGNGLSRASPTAGRISLKHIYEVAKIKCLDPDLEVVGLEKVAKSVLGSAKTLGLEVVP